MAVILIHATVLAAEPPKAFNPLVLERQPLPAVTAWRQSLSEMYPPLRGFRAPVLEHAATPWPITLSENAIPEIEQAALVVAQRLPVDGLVATTIQTIAILGPAEFLSKPASEQMNDLKQCGLPVDLFLLFEIVESDSTTTIRGLDVRDIAQQLADGADVGIVAAKLANKVTFRFRPSRPRFQIASESGEWDAGLFRMQLTRGDDWLAFGDGGSVDMLRQMISAAPDAKFVVAIHRDHLPTFLETSKDWRSVDLALMVEPFTLSQWAQDNGKAGVLRNATGEPIGVATMAPRYASRDEKGSFFIPGDTFVMDSLKESGHAVVQSPLLFQGGNLVAVREPANGRLILLIGEAEIVRNAALGLTREQVLDAMRIEFAVDECRVIPAVSFHIDYDVSIRAVDGRLVAFVRDSAAAIRLVLKAGVGALTRAGHCDEAAGQRAIHEIDAGRPEEFLRVIGPVLARNVDRAGHFSESFARAFSTSTADSHVGNLRLFLAAMDQFVHRVARSSNAHTRAYLESFARLEADERQLAARFREWGWDVVPVPAFGEGNRAISPLNGLHDRTRYFMPTVGGLYQAVDEAALEVFRRTLGPGVDVIGIRCAESQRRAGALHCSISTYPKINGREESGQN